MLRGTIDCVRFRGAALEGNPLGDPVERELLVYLPPSYHIAGSPTATQSPRSGQPGNDRRYPVLFVLTGYASSHQSLLNFKPWEPNFLERYERLLAQGCPEAILVMPDCFTRWGGSQFIDSSAVGAYQQYLADDVVALVDARYRTVARREARGIIGKSSGGFGALRMLLDRPERFSVVGSHAGDCAFELSIRPRFAESAVVYERHQGIEGFAARMSEQIAAGLGGPRSQAEFHALELLALAAVYAPVSSGPWPRGALPFHPYTAEIVPETWARWLAHDPLELVNTRESALAEARFVFLDAGKSDEYGLQFGARMLAQRLANSLGARLQHEEFEGGHMGTAHRYDVSLPRILAVLAEASSERAGDSRSISGSRRTQ